MNDDKPFYQHHVFFCLNEREGKDCRPSCGKHGAESAQQHAKSRIKQLGRASLPSRMFMQKNT